MNGTKHGTEATGAENYELRITKVIPRVTADAERASEV